MATLMPRGACVTDTNRLLCYYRPSPDRKRILFGGRPAYTEIPPQESARRLASYLHELFPALANIPVTHSWFGMIAYTFDRVPHVGRSTAFTTPAATAARASSWRHGSATRSRIGARQRRGDDRIRGDRTSDAPALFRRPWFLPFVQAWYQAADLWERRA
jgi:glycine/D-amino acid oxidase-like deaminating enzyme